VEPSVPDATAPAVAAALQPLACAKDEDCVPTCKLGAVSREWYVAHELELDDWGCQDGCASKGLVARCQASSCVTIDTTFGKEKPAPECTSKALPPLDPDVPYRCSADADCTMSCAFGALNARWYNAHQRRLAECKDGCAEVAAPRCVKGLCAAFEGNKLDPGCTRKKVRLTAR
jgi:hypothetical protein